MKNTRNPHNWLYALAIATALMSSSASQAEIRLASDWEDHSSMTYKLRADEGSKLENARRAEAWRLAATPENAELGDVNHALPFQLYFDDRKYYIQPMRFMAKDAPGEVCNPTADKGSLNYRCQEGQYYKHSCHLMFFNTQFELVGLHRIRTDEPFPVWCNAVPAIGVYDKKKNELLVTFQYFPVDRKAASKISEVGSGWIRMTSLFRLKEEDGRILVEQDDACLKNPNRIETIPDARKKLRQCEKGN